MSFDGGFIGSQEHALTNLHIGRQQGYDDGYRQGFEQGKVYAWNEAWNQANQKLDALARLSELEKEGADEKYQRLLREFNQFFLFGKSVRNVLLELMANGDVDPDVVKRRFRKIYREELNGSIERGAVSAPLETSADFAEVNPQTYKFLIEMLLLMPKQHTSKPEAKV